MNHFFAYLFRMKHIKRWGLMRNASEENLEEHTLEVALLAHALASIRRDVLGIPCDPERVAAAAMFHDASEILTGDLPTPVKYMTAELTGAYREIEHAAEEKLLSFLPQVVLLFFFLSVLEDSGYLSRVAFIFEDILGKVGLSGKSVYTLLMGFGCSTTAIMTARNMDNKNSKIKTALVCPYMSCSAKIPIYAVIGGAFFGANNIFVIIGLYLLGVIVAITISKLLDMTVLKSNNQTFILEFPPYRRMSLKRTGKVLLENSKHFLVKVGSIMISMNIIIFLLSSFSFLFSYCPDGTGSMLQTIGKFLSPIFAPLGFDNWAVVSALLAGLVAKEVVVSSIAMFNGIDSSATRLISESLLISTSAVYFASHASVLSFLVFSLLYVPCISSISMLIQEVGKKWTIIGVLIELVTAYIISFLVFNIAFTIELFGWSAVFVLVAIIFIFLSFIFIYKFVKHKKCTGLCQNCKKRCGRRHRR